AGHGKDSFAYGFHGFGKGERLSGATAFLEANAMPTRHNVSNRAATGTGCAVIALHSFFSPRHHAISFSSDPARERGRAGLWPGLHGYAAQRGRPHAAPAARAQPAHRRIRAA